MKKSQSSNRVGRVVPSLFPRNTVLSSMCLQIQTKYSGTTNSLTPTFSPSRNFSATGTWTELCTRKHQRMGCSEYSWLSSRRLTKNTSMKWTLPNCWIAQSSIKYRRHRQSRSRWTFQWRSCCSTPPWHLSPPLPTTTITTTSSTLITPWVPKHSLKAWTSNWTLSPQM